MAFFTIGSGIGLIMTAAYLISFSALHPSISQLQLAIVGVRFFGIFRGVFRYLERIITHNITFKLLKKYRIWFFQKIIPLAPAKLYSYNTGDLLRRVVSDVESLENIYIRLLLPPLTAFLISITMWFLFKFFSIQLAILITVSLYLSGLIIPFICYLAAKKDGQKITILQSQLTVNNIDLTQGLADLCVFNRCDYFYNRFKEINNKLSYLQKKDIFINSINLSAINMIMSIAVLISIYIMVPQIHSNLIGGITCAAIILGIMASFESVAALPNAFQHLGAAQESSKRIFEIINSDPEISESDISVSPKPSKIDLHVKNINFKYSANSPFALNNISFNLPLGSRIAFVGPSGSGKSSIINLLMKFWNFEKGSIDIDNYSIRKFKQNDLNKIFSVSPQNIYMFNESIKHNLLLSNMNASDNDIIESLKLAEIFDFIDSLPKGINTNLGEQGLIFSGGELRRISIARAMLSEAPILVLDEPSADLDNKNADRIMNNIFNSGRRRSIILITHILSNILTQYDNILTFRDGKIIEQGKHKELLEDKNSLYRKMYLKQNKAL